MVEGFLHSPPPNARAAKARQAARTRPDRRRGLAHSGKKPGMRVQEGFVVLSSAVCSGARAGEIARALVAARLAACVQVTPAENTYRWQGEVQAGPESCSRQRPRATG